ncbi:MAG: CoA transferase, partial [Succiniclasticum sp.]
MSSWNLALNRNKRGITVNLKTEEGKDILKKLMM